MFGERRQIERGLCKFLRRRYLFISIHTVDDDTCSERGRPRGICDTLTSLAYASQSDICIAVPFAWLPGSPDASQTCFAVSQEHAVSHGKITGNPNFTSSAAAAAPPPPPPPFSPLIPHLTRDALHECARKCKQACSRPFGCTLRDISVPVFFLLLLVLKKKINGAHAQRGNW